MNTSTINDKEIEKFGKLSEFWWDKEGPLKTLHDINPIRIQFIKNQIELNNHRVLDVGCGGGILCEALSLNKASVTGIDAESRLILVAQNHATMNGLKINYLCTPIENYESPLYDIITCMEMLEHVDNPQTVLEHCHRLLKPGGLFFVSTISRTLKAYAEVILIAEYILNLLPRQTHDFDRFIKPSELMNTARSLGFELVCLQGINYNPFSRTASLGTQVDANYLMALRK